MTLFEDVDFGLDQFFKFGGLLHENFRNCLDCHCGIGPFIVGLIDNCPGSLPKHFDEVERLHALPHHVLVN